MCKDDKVSSLGSISLPHQRGVSGWDTRLGSCHHPPVCTRGCCTLSRHMGLLECSTGIPEPTHAQEHAISFVPGHAYDSGKGALGQVAKLMDREHWRSQWEAGSRRGHTALQCGLVTCICRKAGLNRQCGQPVLLPEFQGAACSTSARDPMPPAGGSPDRNPTSLSHHASEPPNHQAGIGQHIPHNLVSCSNSDICQEVVNPRGLARHLSKARPQHSRQRWEGMITTKCVQLLNEGNIVRQQIPHVHKLTLASPVHEFLREGGSS